MAIAAFPHKRVLVLAVFLVITYWANTPLIIDKLEAFCLHAANNNPPAYHHPVPFMPTICSIYLDSSSYFIGSGVKYCVVGRSNSIRQVGKVFTITQSEVIRNNLKDI